MASVVLCRNEDERRLLGQYLVGVKAVTHIDDPCEVLVRWGNRASDVMSEVTLNTPAVLQGIVSKRNIMAILTLNRVRCLRLVNARREDAWRMWVNQQSLNEQTPEQFILETLNWKVRYHVHVANLKVISLNEETRNQKTMRIISDRQDKETIKICEIAVHTIHLLGLDFGRVEIALNADSRPVVTDVDPSPRLSNRLARLYAGAISEYVAELTRVLRGEEQPAIRMGADPEFMLRHRDTGKMIVASRFFPNAGPVGCDARTMSENRKQRPLAELRPEPDPSPQRLTENIRRTMALAIKLAPYRNVEWLAGSLPFRGYPVGGHIHFTGIKLNSLLLRAFDNYLAIPVMLMEYQKTAQARRRRYGRLGDHRYKGHGGFEYRTLSSWLISPAVSRAVLSLAGLVCRNYLSLQENHLVSFQEQQAFYLNDKAQFRDWFERLWEQVAGFAEFEEWGSDLETIFNLVANRQVWSEADDFRRAWKLAIPAANYRLVATD